MNLINYKEKNLFEEINNWINIDFDNVTSQYSIHNDNTPWIFWLWDSKENAIKEYLSWLQDMILISHTKKNETTAVA